MTAIHRRAMLRAMLGSAAVLPAASLMPDPAKSQLLTLGAGFNLSEAFDLLYMSDLIYGPSSIETPVGFMQRWGTKPLFQPKTPNSVTDGLYALWKNNSIPNTYAIIVRGTVGTFSNSAWVNLLVDQVKATGSLTIQGQTIPYQFAADAKASVHEGYALATLLLLMGEIKPPDPSVGILAQLKNVGPISNIYVAGHSQGAAVAVLLSSYLYYSNASKTYSSKTYAFASPKPGNDHYETDFGKVFGNTGFAFRLTNSLDIIPEQPITTETGSDLNPVGGGPAAETAFLNTLNAAESSEEETIAKTSKASLQVTALAHPVFTIPKVNSKYYVSVGTLIALIGTPCTPSQCNFLYQHHPSTYNTLMQKQLS